MVLFALAGVLVLLSVAVFLDSWRQARVVDLAAREAQAAGGTRRRGTWPSRRAPSTGWP